MNNKRHKQSNVPFLKACVIDLKERQNAGLIDIDRVKAVGQKLTLVLVTQGQCQRKFFAQTTCRDQIQLMRILRILRDATAHYPERARDQMQRCLHRFGKAGANGDLLAELSQRTECVN